MRLLIVLSISSLLLGSAVLASDTTSAVVTGAELLYVRRGPGVTFPAFATIERGERVDVERLEGVWALVRLASGQSGYVHSTFLSFPGETRATIIVPATATPTPTREAEASPTSEASTGVSTGTPPSQRANERAAPEASAASAPAQSDNAAAPDAKSDLATLRGDVQRLTVAVEVLQRRIGDSTTGDAVGDHAWRSGAVGALVLLALLIGWMGGSAYGRQSERSRRSRIRF